MAKERIKYSPETKAKIIETVVSTRKTGSWKDAHAAAQTIGYRGGMDSLKQMMKDVKKAAKKAAKSTAKTPKASPKPKVKPAAGKKRNYDAATKVAIVKATVAARNAGKKWPEALVAAKAAGYQGGQISLGLFVKGAAKPAKKRGRPAKMTVVAPAPKKRGRPPKVAAPAVPALDPVAAQYLVGAIDKAIGELEALRKQYAK